MMHAGSHGRGFVVRGCLAAALLASACSGPPRPAAPPPAAPLRGIAPTGVVTPPITFRWEGNPADATVRVSIQDRAERPVFAFPARGSNATAPEGIAAVLTPGEPFTWTVAALDDDGNETRRSAPLTMTRARRD